MFTGTLPFQPTLTPSLLKRTGLNLKQARVNGELVGKVHSFIQLEASGITPYPVLPDGCQAIFIGPTGSFLSGLQLQKWRALLPTKGLYFGIHFCPGALRHFFPATLTHLNGAKLSESEFPALQSLSSALYKAERFADRIRICERWLLQYYVPVQADGFDYLSSLISHHPGAWNVQALADLVGRSSRQVNRWFSQYTGTNTKTFCKIMRAQRVCQLLAENSETPLDLVASQGFVDQSHLINEFRQFVGESPGQYTTALMSDFSNP